ncbi:MAG: PEGA domain-containing protein [Puniceicoccaceae bacterium]
MSIRFPLARSLSFRFPFLLPLAVAVLGLSGCGTLSRETLDIRAEPEGAFVYVNGKFIGNSPVDLALNRQVPHRVEVRNVGFLTKKVTVLPSYRGDKKPAVVFGPLHEDGFYRSLRPNPVEVTLLYEGLAEVEGPLGEEEADRLFARIGRELEAGELTPAEARLAVDQVEARLVGAAAE